MRPIFTAVFILLISGLLVSCGKQDNIPKSLKENKDIPELINIAESHLSDPAARYAALEPVIAEARKNREFYWLTAYLGRILEKHPSDPYGAYYLMAMAGNAEFTGTAETSLYYLRRLVKNYPDLIIKGQSLHLKALMQIAEKSEDPREAIAAREKLQEKYSDQIDAGRNAYELAEDYRKTGEWDKMYKAYEEFLKYPDTKIPGNPKARYRVKSRLEFHNSSKTWTMENLDDLVGTIKYAIRTKNAALLSKYQSQNFFFMNWSQEDSDSFTHIPMTLSSFLKNNIRYNRDLEDFSNDHEAYLMTRGWTWHNRPWYLYFRRVDYPEDPEINGNWEWAGIYFGGKL